MEEQHKFSTNKTSLADVWIGTQEQLQGIRNLVIRNSRLMIYASHFIKYFSISQNYFEYNELDCAAILSLLNNPNSNSRGTDRFKNHIQEFMRIINCRGEGISYFQNFALYHGKVLESQYLTNIQEHFIQKVKAYCTFMIVERFKNQVPEGIQRNENLRVLRERARQVQNCCLDLQLDYGPLNDYDQGIVRSIRNIFPVEINQNGIHYDVIARAVKYAEPYYRLALLYDEQGMKKFNVFPLCTSTIPRHMTLDTLLLCRHVLHQVGELRIRELKEEYWSEVVDLNKKAFKGRNGMFFKGIIYPNLGLVHTDGISISVTLDDRAVARRQKRKRRGVEPSMYFEDNLDEIRPNKVYIDPNRRDLLYCLGEDENGDDAKLRYTSMQRKRESGAKKHDQIRHRIEFGAGLRGNDNVRHPTVPLPPRATLDIAAFRLYLLNYFGTISEKEAVYSRSVFRKLKFSKYHLTQKSEAEFVKKVKMKYGQPQNTTIFLGDWSQTHSVKFHAPTKIQGFRKMFQRAGFNVLLVNEFKTSSVCPTCHHQSLETFVQRPSPRPWRRGALVTVHGLLRCQSEICQQFVNGQRLPRLWNRDDIATLNIRAIVEETLADGDRPMRFRRTTNTPN